LIWYSDKNRRSDGCWLFEAFYKNKLDYLKVKKNKSEEEEEGNAFTCSKKEMEVFFSESHNTWIQ